MNLNKLNSKVKIINDELPVEVFCKKKIKNYYVRGQVIEQKISIWEPNPYKRLGDAIYRLYLFVLVNKEYQRKCIEPLINTHIKDNLPQSKAYFSPIIFPTIHVNLTEMGFYFGIFFGNTEKEFLKKMNIIDLNYLCIDDERPGGWEFERDFEDDPVNTKNNPSIYIDYADINLDKKDPYILDSIRKNKSIILLDMDIVIDRVTSKEITNSIPEIISYAGGNFYLSLSRHHTPGELLQTLPHLLFNTIYNNCNFQLMNKLEYEQILTKIGYLCYAWHKFNNINSEFLSALNSLKKYRNNNYNIFKNFCFKFYDNLIESLLLKNEINRCQFCGDYFKYLKGKKYCSLKSEGKDCGKRARNKRFYKDHKETILPNARKVTRELRQWYKEKGIKK
ncbi:hypothetical protein ES708_21961 [subsurface metagenome]